MRPAHRSPCDAGLAGTSTLCTSLGTQGRFAGRQSAEVTAEPQGSPTIFCARRGRRLAGGRRTSPAKPFAGSTQSNICASATKTWLAHQGTSCIACSSGCRLGPEIDITEPGSSDNRHQLYGNRMRHQQVSLADVAEDVRWKVEMPSADRRIVSCLSWPLRWRYGY